MTEDTERIWEPGWFEKILEQAEKEVQSWPEWMQKPEMRYPMNRHRIKDDQSRDVLIEDLVGFIESIAEQDCSYGSGCPDEELHRHYRCDSCRARLISADLDMMSGDTDEEV
jgi:hypothetical protein